MLHKVPSSKAAKPTAGRKHVSTGYYDGPVRAEWRRGGRRMTIVADVAFISSDGSKWAVPAGAVIDGASIPRLLWPIVGSPYTGLYRDASVIHDYYCSVRSRPSHDVHAMFHEAMLSGVAHRQARLMYLAVVYAGPSWTEMDVANVKVALATSSGFTAGDAETNLVLQTRRRYPLAPGIVPELQEEINIKSKTTALMLQCALWARRARSLPTVSILLRRSVDECFVNDFMRLTQIVENQELDLEQINELVEADLRLPNASLA